MRIKNFEAFINESEEPTTLKQFIYDALENCIENEYFKEAFVDSPAETAGDIMDTTNLEDFGPIESKDIEEIIIEWRKEKGAGHTTMYNLKKENIDELEKIGAIVVKDFRASTKDDSHYSVGFPNEDVKKKIIDWVEKNDYIPSDDIKELFPELFA